MATDDKESATDDKELANDFSPYIRVYKDGTVERLFGSPHVPPTPEDTTTGVSSKDITISPHISARLYRPKLTSTSPQTKLPILIYFHGGGFCLESAFSLLDHNYLNLIVSQSNALAVSVEYRLAPENPLPAAYEDCWEALQWVASHSIQENINKDPWLTDCGDFDRLYIGGDSAGGNIVHNVALRAGKERLKGDVKILGGFLSYPYFWSSKAPNSEESVPYKIWMLAYPCAPGGIDNPMMNPCVDGEARRSLAEIGCSRLLVVVAEKDELRDYGVEYYKAVGESSWEGEVELVEVEGEDHCFNIFNPDAEKSKNLLKRLASFIV